MIKLVMTDLDGTLLDAKKEIPKDFWQTVDEMAKKDILLAVASGRTLSSVKNAFKEGEEKLILIASNGSVLVKNNEILYANTMPQPVVDRIIDVCSKIDDIHLMINTVGADYTLSLKGKKWHAEIIERSYNIPVTVVEDLKTVSANVLQISVCQEKGVRDNIFKLLHENFSNELEVVVSDIWWLDIMNKGVNKASPLKIIKEKFDIAPEEVMAFGDFDNDIAMLKAVGTACVMQNAQEHMYKYADHIVPKNTENGVIETIKKMLL